ncbi:MAG: rhodanese-related sulfurtransferase [Rhodospirillales bacterium]|nr:rhodanese-related sulfurtransferase [Alphaproteobacteria bacterium]MCB9977897.1 rhodanese-related sulfurtransferase [Rhodospirillales bacterium]
MKKDLYKIAALYRFVPVTDIPALRAEIRQFGESCEGMCGTLLLAPEGVNGTIAAKPEALDRMIGFLDQKLGILQGEVKYSSCEGTPFNRFKVRPKKEIITLKRPEADPNRQVGEYVSAQDWNALLADPEVVLIDTRNEYETRVGIFKNALDPKLDVFTQFPEWVEQNLDPEKHKKVAMFCTGGIRCEKASAYMLAHGFEKVYHLKGGILKYLETIPAQESLWEGECFVFDKRVSVGHGLDQGRWDICHGCREPLSQDDLKSAAYEKGVSCPHCIGELTEERAKRLRERQSYYNSRHNGERHGEQQDHGESH